MNDMALPKMTVDEFLAWAAGRPGRYELHGGAVQQMSPERADHVRVKYAVCAALKAAIKQQRLSCEALTDGMTVRVGPSRAFVPDVVVHCEPRLSGSSIEVPAPVIVVEVSSPSTAVIDESVKLTGYFSLPSVQHYLLVDIAERTVIHFRRLDATSIETKILKAGAIALDPPGLEVSVESVFEDLA